MLNIIKNNKKIRSLFYLVYIIFLISIFGNFVIADRDPLSISPNELTIRNMDVNKEYTFIVLVSNELEGLVDVEIKTSDSGVILSPNKFMLNAGEQRSIRVLLNPRRLDDDVERILIQPFANNLATHDQLTIFLNQDEQRITLEESSGGIQTIIDEPEIVRSLIYILLGIVAIMIILIFLPEIKKNISGIKSKSVKINDKLYYKKVNTKLKSMDNKLNSADKKIKYIIHKVEKFHSDAHNWLKENSGGKHGLE